MSNETRSAENLLEGYASEAQQFNKAFEDIREMCKFDDHGGCKINTADGCNILICPLTRIT
jgi:hypothetical protein